MGFYSIQCILHIELKIIYLHKAISFNTFPLIHLFLPLAICPTFFVIL